MSRQHPTRVYACPPPRQPGGTAAKWRLASYLVLAAGIWIAYFWLVFSRPVVMTSPLPPAVDGSFLKSPGAANDQLLSIDVARGANNRQDAPLPRVTVVAPAMRLNSAIPSEYSDFDTAGYTARKQLVLDIQRALGQYGCYRGEMTGLWSAETKRALRAFLAAANARLPIEQPDDILLHLVKGHDHVVCGEKRSIETRVDAPFDTNPRRTVPPGLMGIGGPKPATSAANAHPSDEPAIGRARKQTVRKVADEAEGSGTPRSPLGQRSVRELLTHPLGTY